jgi:uncharacterized protein affecting Mg2+/Co2+ transport
MRSQCGKCASLKLLVESRILRCDSLPEMERYLMAFQSEISQAGEVKDPHQQKK